MNKICRNGVDVKVAFSSVRTHQLLDTHSAFNKSLQSKWFELAVSKFKQILRKVVKINYRLIKPFVRPIAFRARSYFLQGMKQEVMQCTHQPVAAAEKFQSVAIHCDSGQVLIKTQVGYVLCVSTDHRMLACLLESGDLERGTRLLIEKFLKPGDAYIDVGANVGMHVLAAARSMQGKGRIIAFEPFQANKLMLEKTVGINGCSEITEIHQAAVSHASGFGTLFTVPDCSGHNSLFAFDDGVDKTSSSVEVPLVTLDEVVDKNQSINLIKIDAEGAELSVLEGSKKLLENNHNVALIVEFGPSHIHRIGKTPQEWLAAFTDLGFCFQVINTYSGVLEHWTTQQLEEAYSVNLFFARKDSAAWKLVA